MALSAESGEGDASLGAADRHAGWTEMARLDEKHVVGLEARTYANLLAERSVRTGVELRFQARPATVGPAP